MYKILESNSVCDHESTNAFKFMYQFLVQRSRLQKAISTYIDIRAARRQCEAGKCESAFM
jgi:hypothetical protein